MRLAGSSAVGIARSVRRSIEARVLRPGQSLPPIRTLSTELGVNRNTVAAAYSQLALWGLVDARGRAGTVVLGAPSLEGEGLRVPSSVANLASGNPDPSLLPDIPSLGEFVPPLYGAEPINPWLAHVAHERMSADVDALYRFSVTHGSVDAVERILGAHLSRRAVVAVENPCFLSSIGVLRLNGYRTRSVAVDQEGMTAEALETALQSGASAVIITPRAHNPTGASVSRSRARELQAVLARFPEVLVIEDDHFSEVSSTPYNRVTPPDALKWALVRSVSKFLGPDLRVAMVLTDPDTAVKLEGRLSSATTWVSHILQQMAATLLTDERVRVLLDSARTTYGQRSASLIRALTAEGIDVAQDCDGLNVWVPLTRDEDAVVDALAESGWAVRSGKGFIVGRRAEPAIRVTTATITSDEVVSFTRALAQILSP